MISTDTIEGRWYVSSENDRHIVDHAGYTIADAASARKALQIIKEHNRCAPTPACPECNAYDIHFLSCPFNTLTLAQYNRANKE